MNPKVSVVIPFYNRFSLVKNALTMLLNQDYRNFEVILVNDGSKEIFEIDKIRMKYNFPIIYDELRENCGPGIARRRGRKLAKGDYIAYLDSDDWWSDNFLQECVKVLSTNHILGMVFTDTVCVKNNEESNRRIQDVIPTTILPVLFQNPKRLWSTPSCLWKKEVTLPEHWMDLRTHEDYVHDVKCAMENNNIGFVKNALTYNNHSAVGRIERIPDEVNKALTIISDLELPSQKGFTYFYLQRIWKFRIRLSFPELMKNRWLSRREYDYFSYNYFLFRFLLWLNFFGFRSHHQKRIIQKFNK